MAKRNLFYLLLGATTGGGGGADTSDATATPADIRLDKTAYGAEGKMAGTIPDYDGTTEPTAGKSLFAQMADRSIKEVTASDLKEITGIGDYAFTNCTVLASVDIPDNVTSVGDYAFRGCKGLTSITIPDSVMSIGESVLSYSGVVEAMLPSHLTGIPYGTFAQCFSLSSCQISDKVTSIGNVAFERCRSLTSIIIPDSVVNIGNGSIEGCTGLETIIIGGGVSSIGYRAFENCSILTELGGMYIIKAITPPTIQDSTFKNAKINKIIVPKGSGDAYKAATNWSALADYIEEAAE